ncbi:hypothetical protein Q3H58_001127 [Pseudomonas psychrotolerans]|nr:hypothetical protein [Pseudomonas psychrotolerans]
MLLADEVGLGKTIEAGLVIHRQLLSGRASRVLILVPENLQHQWLVEMRRRFNLEVALFDAERFMASEEGNPFEDAQLALVSLDWLVRDEKAQDAAFAAGWDLLVVDEAHHLVWHPEGASREYSLVEQLGEVIPGVLLLTATPEQLGQDSHFARLRLLDPSRFHDFAAFQQESQHYRPVAEAVQELLDAGALSPAAQDAIGGFLGQEGEALLSAAAAGDADARARLVRELLDRHGTGRVLFRNTRAAVKGFPERELHAHALPFPDAYLDEGVMPGQSLQPETEFAPEDDNDRWWRHDGRVEWLIDTLKALKPHKVLVICARMETALDLEDALRLKSGIPATVFHEGMSILERDRAAAYFADEEFGAQVLICSEIGSEGRNFQFAHHLVLFDLPAHPDLLEQRIGRLDRIGQRHTIQLHVPYLEGSRQERQFQWYHQALNAFLATSPTGSALQARFASELEEQLAGGDEATWQALLEQGAQARAALEAELHNGRDPPAGTQLLGCRRRRATGRGHPRTGRPVRPADVHGRVVQRLRHRQRRPLRQRPHPQAQREDARRRLPPRRRRRRDHHLRPQRGPGPRRHAIPDLGAPHGPGRHGFGAIRLHGQHRRGADQEQGAQTGHRAPGADLRQRGGGPARPAAGSLPAAAGDPLPARRQRQRPGRPGGLRDTERPVGKRTAHQRQQVRPGPARLPGQADRRR